MNYKDYGSSANAYNAMFGNSDYPTSVQDHPNFCECGEEIADSEEFCKPCEMQSDKVYDQCRDNGDDFVDLKELFGDAA